jgi:hypothetical protein
MWPVNYIFRTFVPECMVKIHALRCELTIKQPGITARTCKNEMQPCPESVLPIKQMKL